jgi:hypothetical protein
MGFGGARSGPNYEPAFGEMKKAWESLPRPLGFNKETNDYWVVSGGSKWVAARILQTGLVDTSPMV